MGARQSLRVRRCGRKLSSTTVVASFKWCMSFLQAFASCRAKMWAWYVLPPPEEGRCRSCASLYFFPCFLYNNCSLKKLAKRASLHYTLYLWNVCWRFFCFLFLITLVSIQIFNFLAYFIGAVLSWQEKPSSTSSFARTSLGCGPDFARLSKDCRSPVLGILLKMEKPPLHIAVWCPLLLHVTIRRWTMLF